MQLSRFIPVAAVLAVSTAFPTMPQSLAARSMPWDSIGQNPEPFDFEAGRDYDNVEFPEGEHPAEEAQKKADQMAKNCWNIQKRIHLDSQFVDKIWGGYLIECLKHAQDSTSMVPATTPAMDREIQREANQNYIKCREEGRSKPDCTEEASYDDGRIRPKTGYFYDTSEPESTYASDGSEGMSSVKDALLAGAKNAMMAIPMAIGGGLAALRAGSGNTVTQ